MNTFPIKKTHWFWNIFIGLGFGIIAYLISALDIKGAKGERSEWIGNLIYFFRENGLTWIPVCIFLFVFAYNFYLAGKKLFSR